MRNTDEFREIIDHINMLELNVEKVIAITLLVRI